MEQSASTHALAQRMSTQLRIRGEGLEDIATRAGRKLPRHVRTSVDILIEAEAMRSHPKLSRRIDPRRIARAERVVNRFLDKQNPAAERRGEVLDLVAKIAFVVVVVVLSVFFFLLWRGDL